MKALRSNLIMFFLSLLIFSCANSKIEEKIVQDERVEVSFNRNMTFDDLNEIKRELSKKRIDIMYKSIAFDENGGLKSLEFNVDCKDGFSGGATNKSIGNNTHWGFYRDYSQETDTPFGTGNLN